MHDANATITLYERRSCSTCKRARVALTQTGAQFETIDIFRNQLTVDDIEGLLGTLPVSDVFSWKSPQARVRGITPGTKSDSELLALMAEEPRLIRRPLIRIGEQLVIGADIPQLTRLLGSSG